MSIIRQLFSSAILYLPKQMASNMKLNSAEFRILFTPGLKQLSDIFKKNGFELRMAGGAVRDLLMGSRPADIDFATDATPEQMKEVFTREQVRMLNKNGEEHGTITCRLNDKENFEITTLRIDVVCDGRRAAVKYTKSWEEDAFRRDLTINSLFLDLDGVVYDYTGGVQDINQRRIVFVGNPVQRLQEDYLRILRYFRFFGRYARLNQSHDPDNIAAIVQCRDGLQRISGERIWMELHRIIVGRLASPLIRTMLVDCGLGAYLAVAPDRMEEFERVARANALKGDDGPLNLEPATALSALFADFECAQRFQSRCKCSNAERTLCETIVARRDEARERRNDVRYFKHMVLDQLFEMGGEMKETSLKNCIELLKYVEASSEVIREIQDWEMERFPVGGMDLLNAKVPKGPRMKCTLRHLFNLWKESDLQISREELLKHADDPEIAELEQTELGKSKRRRPSKRKQTN